MPLHQLSYALIEQGNHMIPGLRVTHQGSRRCAGIAADVDRNRILGVGIQDDHEIVGLERMGKAAGGALLLWRQRAGSGNDRQEVVGTSDGRVRLQPVVAAEGAATRSRGPCIIRT